MTSWKSRVALCDCAAHEWKSNWPATSVIVPSARNSSLSGPAGTEKVDTDRSASYCNPVHSAIDFRQDTSSREPEKKQIYRDAHQPNPYNTHTNNACRGSSRAHGDLLPKVVL
jgi:hypothetical protein